MLSNASVFTYFHLNIICFDTTLRNMRASLSDKVMYVVKIGLPFSVQAHIDSTNNIRSKYDISRMVYVYLNMYVKHMHLRITAMSPKLYN